MSRITNNQLSSMDPSTQDLVLRGKNIVIQGENGTVPLTGDPLPSATDFVQKTGSVAENITGEKTFTTHAPKSSVAAAAADDLVRKDQLDAVETIAISGYKTIEDNGTPVTQRDTVNFTGAGVSVSDSGGKTVVNITVGSSFPAWMTQRSGFPMNLFGFAGLSFFVQNGSNVMAYSTGGPSTLYSSDGGVTWFTGAAVSQATSVASLNIIGGVPYIVRCDTTGSNTSAYSTNYGQSWTAGGTLPSSGTWTQTVATIVGGVPRVVALRGVSNVSAITTDGGSTWIPGGTLPSSGTWIPTETTLGGTPRIVATKDGSNEIAITTDGGVTWVAGGALPSSGSWVPYSITLGGVPRILAIKLSTLDCAYSTNGGASWTLGGNLTGQNTFSGFAGSRFSGVAVGGKFYTFIAGGSLAVTEDGGVTWAHRGKTVSSQHLFLAYFNNAIGEFLYSGGNVSGGTAFFVV